MLRAGVSIILGPGSMQAITLKAPPHSLQASMSMLNTRFKRRAQVIVARSSTGAASGASTGAGVAPKPLSMLANDTAGVAIEVVLAPCASRLHLRLDPEEPENLAMIFSMKDSPPWLRNNWLEP